jgi:NADPH2 dehydrogenase
VKVTDAVHKKGSFIYLQLWAIGPTANPEALKADNPGQNVVPVGPSDVKLTGATVAPRPLTIPEIKEYVQWFKRAAEAAVDKAGFDGVMVHGSNGYLIDQFLQDVSNKRTDEYGGSIENRARFALEVLEAVTKSIGEDRTSIRVGPWATMYGERRIPFGSYTGCRQRLTSPIGMRMDDPIPTFSYLARRIKELYPNLAFFDASEVDRPRDGKESNEFLRDIWAPNVFMSNGGYNRQKGMELADRTGGLVAYGKSFLANVRTSSLSINLFVCRF